MKKRVHFEEKEDIRKSPLFSTCKSLFLLYKGVQSNLKFSTNLGSIRSLRSCSINSLVILLALLIKFFLLLQLVIIILEICNIRESFKVIHRHSILNLNLSTYTVFANSY